MPQALPTGTAPAAPDGGTAKQRYLQLAIRREPFLRRARDFAQLTIPSLLPPEGHTQMERLPETYQSFGARCVTSLSSRLMIAFLPPGVRALRLTVTPEAKLAAGVQSVDKDTEQGLALSEETIHSEIEKAKWRPTTFVGLQHLIVAGNYMEQTLPDNTLKGYRLDQFVVVRNPSGEMIEFVIEEYLATATLEADLKGMVDTAGGNNAVTLPLYTWGKYNTAEDRWIIHQEFQGQKVPKSEGKWQINPFRALRYVEVWGEDYGRSKVEEHWGDFRSLEGLSKAVVDGAAMASRNVTLLRPNAAGGLNLRRRLIKANNGDFVVANPEDIAMLSFENRQGMQLTVEARAEIKHELASAFLMHSSAQRDAERVTAFEFRKMIEEIESVLGGVFTSLQDDIQEARIQRLILQMKDQGKLPNWPADVIQPTILTGLEALGRERDVERVSTGLQFLTGLPENIHDYVKWDVLLGKAFNGLQLPDAVRTDDEVRKMQADRIEQQATAEAMVRAAGQRPPTEG